MLKEVNNTDCDLLERLNQKLPKMSKGHKRIAGFLIEHYDKAAFFTASRLGSEVGVSESTVVRFATEMGFSGYPSLQKALHELVQNKLTSVQRINVTDDQLSGGADIVGTVLDRDLDNIRKTLNSLSKKDFSEAVKDITSAKRIYIIGTRSAAALANFLSFYFKLMFEHVQLVQTTSKSEMFEQILRIGKDDVLIGISFPRYSSNTAQAFSYAHNNGGKTIAITDSKKSPLAKEADHLLLAKSDMISFVDSLVAPLSIINALIVAVGIEKREEISQTFQKLEYIWDEYQVYEGNKKQ